MKRIAEVGLYIFVALVAFLGAKLVIGVASIVLQAVVIGGIVLVCAGAAVGAAALLGGDDRPKELGK